MFIFIAVFDFIQGNILYGDVFAMELRLEDFSLATLTQRRDQVWFEITFNCEKMSFEG